MTQKPNIYFYYKEDPVHREKAQPLVQLASEKFNIVSKSQDANIIISLGGDGTFLQSVRKTGFRDDCLYIGVSTLGHHTFYNDFTIEDMTHEILDVIAQNDMQVRDYPVLEVSIDGEVSYYCLNEFSIQSSIVKTFVIDIFIDDLHFETFRGDGLIISTPTGSTGYNKSAHGALVDPYLSCMQIIELASLNNNQYRTLDSPFILSGRRKLTLKMVKEGNEFPIMAMDNEAISLRHLENIEIKISDKRIQTIRIKDNSFWHKVKRTFL